MSTSTQVSIIKSKLEAALDQARTLALSIRAEDPESPFLRKLDFYLIPNLNHWIDGAQAGGIKDLEKSIMK